MIKKQTIRLNETQLRRVVSESVKKMLKERSTFRFDNTPMGTYNKMSRYDSLIWDLINVVRKMKKLSGKSSTMQSNDSIDNKVWDLANEIESLIGQYGLDDNSFNPDDWYPDERQSRFDESLKMTTKKKVLKEGLNREKGISILKQASEAFIQWKKTEEELNNFYKKSGIKPDCFWLYRCRDHFFDIMQMNRGDVLHPYIHPFIDSLAEIMYNNGLNVDDVVSLNIPPFNMVSAEKIKNAFNKYKDEMEDAERIQHYEDIRNEHQAIWDDNSAYISKTTGTPEDEL